MGVNRSRLLEKTNSVLDAESQIFKFIACILRENTIRIHDGLTHSQGIQQTNVILQGDPISPLIFNVLTHDVVQRIQTEEVRIWLYADGMILLSERREPLQEVINKVVTEK